MEKTRKRKLIERSTIWIITFLGLLTFAIFDLWFAYPYKIDGFMDWQWLMFWTHMSNVLAFIWISMALMSAFVDCNERENMVGHWLIKNTIYTFIITTGLIFCAVAYIPTVITYSTAGSISGLESLVIDYALGGQLLDSTGVVGSNYLEIKASVDALVLGGQTTFETINGFAIETDPSAAYRSFVIIGTTIKHVIIPGMFIYLGVTEIGYTRVNGMGRFKRTMIQFAFPSMYLVYAVTLSSTGIVNPPYPVIDLGFTEHFQSLDQNEQIIRVIVYVILDITVGVIFAATSYLLYVWSDKQLEKWSKEQTDLVCINNAKINEELNDEKNHQDWDN